MCAQRSGSETATALCAAASRPRGESCPADYLQWSASILLRRRGILATSAGLMRSSSTASPPINLAVRQLAGGPWAVIVAMGVKNAIRREVLGIKLSNLENLAI